MFMMMVMMKDGEGYGDGDDDNCDDVVTVDSFHCARMKLIFCKLSIDYDIISSSLIIMTGSLSKNYIIVFTGLLSKMIIHLGGLASPHCLFTSFLTS